MPQRTDQQLHDEIDAGRTGTPAWWTGPELEQLLKNMVDSKGNRQDTPILEDLMLSVGGGDTYDPPAGVTEINLPAAWSGRRIRVQFGGPDTYNRFTAYTRTANGFELNRPGDATEAGTFWIVENY